MFLSVRSQVDDVTRVTCACASGQQRNGLSTSGGTVSILRLSQPNKIHCCPVPTMSEQDFPNRTKLHIKCSEACQRAAQLSKSCQWNTGCREPCCQSYWRLQCQWIPSSSTTTAGFIPSNHSSWKWTECELTARWVYRGGNATYFHGWRSFHRRLTSFCYLVENASHNKVSLGAAEEFVLEEV